VFTRIANSGGTLERIKSQNLLSGKRPYCYRYLFDVILTVMSNEVIGIFINAYRYILFLCKLSELQNSVILFGLRNS